ncbi:MULTISPECIES: extracellular solute-binding protein [unclassified Nocardiopsis]|uniref:extracellular solute-binding protein n=1 Tax=unclassified Nocardiopsis TaxID=2649073 RepID=UPI00066A818B|nr:MULTISPECIES: extracellular solute-binding protein [unclassified Nocardiopsis]MBQ1079627.1 extracellular solute-binding protein [Nocardiopsis sp. B62]
MSHRRTAITGAVVTLSVLALTSCGNVDAPAGSASGDGDVVITYNSPSEWGNYGEVLRAFTEETGISAPNDPKNSGQALAALQAERGSPVADVAYTGIAFGEQLVEAGVLREYVPEGAEQVPDELRDPDGAWTSVHTGTIALIVNEDHLDGAPVPQSWDDLLDPAYEGRVGYLDPTQAAVGYSAATAVNVALGGDFDDWGPGLDYLNALRDNGAATSAQTATAKVAQGEIPILIDTDFNGYKLRDEGANVSVVIPEEGSLQIPYIVGLVEGAPNEDNGRELLDFYFSEQGQALFAAGYMRPVTGEMPDELADRVLPPEDYERAATVDYVEQGLRQQEFIELYQDEVGF